MSANQSNSNKYSWINIVVPAGFFLIGSFIFWSYFAKPFLKSIDARNWDATTCIIISSQIKKIPTRNGTQDVVDIVYAYELQGKKYQSNRYAFRDKSRDAASIVNRHPPGTRMTCYVNPRDATDAVIERGGFPPDFFVFGVFSFMFMLAGLMGLTRLVPPHIARFIESRNLSETRSMYWVVKIVNFFAGGGKLIYRLVSIGFVLGILALFIAPLIPLIEELGFIEGFTTAITTVIPIAIPIVMIMLVFWGIRSVSRHQQETKKSSWRTFASSRGLTFVPGKFRRHESYVTGTYHHHQLNLKTFNQSRGKSSCTYTFLSLSVDPPVNGSLASRKDVMSLLTPSSPDYLLKNVKLKGSIAAQTVDQNVSLGYVQEGIENDSEYLGKVLDLLSDLSEAYSAVVALGGEVVPFLKDTIARHYHKSIAAELLRAIARNTTARFGERASQVLCSSCLTRYTAHKVLLESLEYISYYGCRTCGQSREFLEGRVVAVLDSRMDTEQSQQDGTVRVNWLMRQTLFDFDEVEIVRATDEDVERFVCQVINDTDEFRRSRYKDMSCIIAADCDLFENSFRILESTFGTTYK